MTYFDKKTFRNGVKKSMNRLFFRILSAFLWVFCLCMWSCAAEPLLRVEDVTLPPEGEFVDLPVSISQNPGITRFKLMIDADRELVMDSIVAGAQAGAMCEPEDFESTTVQVIWSSDQPLEGDGRLFSVRFMMPKPGNYTVSLRLQSMLDAQGRPMEQGVTVGKGVLSVTEDAAGFEVLFFEDASRGEALNADSPQPAGTLSEAFEAVARSKSRVGTVLVRSDTSGRETAAVQAGSDVVVDLCGHSLTVEGAHAISNAGRLVLSDSTASPGLMRSTGGSAVYNTGSLTVQGGAYRGNFAVVNEGGDVLLSGGLFRGEGEPFLGECPLAAQTRLELVEDARDPFYQFWKTAPAPDCTVTFFLEDGVTQWNKVTVGYGSPVTPPKPPAKESDPQFDYDFKGWYTQPSGGQPADFTHVEQSFDVFAVYTAKEHIHHYTPTVVQATCIEKGYTLYQCRCKDSYREDETPLAAHRWEESPFDQVLCCGVCGALRGVVTREVTTAQPQSPAFVVDARCGQELHFGSVSVTLEPQALSALAQGEGALCIRGDLGELVLDAAALRELWQFSGGQPVCVEWGQSEPVRGELATLEQVKLAQMESLGGTSFWWSVLCGGREVFKEGFEEGSALLRVPLALQPDEAAFALAVDQSGGTRELKTALTEGTCAVTLGPTGSLGLMTRTQGVQLSLSEQSRHVDAGTSVGIGLLLQASPGESLDGMSLQVYYDSSVLCFLRADNLPEGVQAVVTPGQEGVVEIVAELQTPLDLSQTETLLATLVFCAAQDAPSGSASLRIGEMPKVTLSGQEQVAPVARSAEIMLWNLTVQFLPGEHAGLEPVTAYVRYGQAGLYQDAARQIPLAQPVPEAQAGYRLEQSCWFVQGEQQPVDFSALCQRTFLQSTTAVATAQPVVYSVTYHTGEGKNHPENPASYTVESPDLPLMDASWEQGRFVMWADGPGEDAQAVSYIAAGSTGDVELWAVWERHEYAVELPPQVRVISGIEEGQAGEFRAQAGVDVVFEAVISQGMRLEKVGYRVGDSAVAELSAQEGVYRIDGELLTGPLSIVVQQRVDGKVTLLDKEQYRALPFGYRVVLLTTQQPLSSGAFVLDKTALFYSEMLSDPQQNRHVYATIATAPKEGEDLSMRLGVDGQAHTETLTAGGDLTGDGVLTADDVRLVYLLYTGKWDTDTAFDISVRQRLLADVNGDGRVDTTDVQLLMAAVWAQQKQEQETP